MDSGYQPRSPAMWESGTPLKEDGREKKQDPVVLPLPTLRMGVVPKMLSPVRGEKINMEELYPRDEEEETTPPGVFTNRSQLCTPTPAPPSKTLHEEVAELREGLSSMSKKITQTVKDTLHLHAGDVTTVLQNALLGDDPYPELKQALSEFVTCIVTKYIEGLYGSPVAAPVFHGEAPFLGVADGRQQVRFDDDVRQLRGKLLSVESEVKGVEKNMGSLRKLLEESKRRGDEWEEAIRGLQEQCDTAAAAQSMPVMSAFSSFVVDKPGGLEFEVDKVRDDLQSIKESMAQHQAIGNSYNQLLEEHSCIRDDVGELKCYAKEAIRDRDSRISALEIVSKKNSINVTRVEAYVQKLTKAVPVSEVTTPACTPSHTPPQSPRMPYAMLAKEALQC